LLKKSAEMMQDAKMFIDGASDMVCTAIRKGRKGQCLPAAV